MEPIEIINWMTNKPILDPSLQDQSKLEGTILKLSEIHDLLITKKDGKITIFLDVKGKLFARR